MWLKTFLFLTTSIILLLLNSCSSNETAKIVKPESEESMKPIKAPVISALKLDTLKGIYIGDFGGSDIRLVINYISNKHAVRYNVHKGLQRNVNGSVEIKEETVELVLAEPGDNEFDGVFHISINKENLDAEGYWKSNNGKISKKHFALKKLNYKSESNSKILDESSFSSIFFNVSDSIGEFNFNDDGLCLYEYYPSKDSVNRKEQLISCKGSWTLKNNIVTIDWQKNTVFPNKKSVFKIEAIKEGDESDPYYMYQLTGENRLFFPRYY